MRADRKSRACAYLALVVAVSGCTPPVRQYDIKNQALTCEQANDYALRTLQGMGFNISGFEPAGIGRPGVLRGSRDEGQKWAQVVTVEITCTGQGADFNPYEDGKWLGQVDFKRAFYMSFTAVAAQSAANAATAREEARRPPTEKKGQGLQVLLSPVRGLGAKLDFDVDIACGGVLPVIVTVNNLTPRTYKIDPADIVLVQKDGTRVHPLLVDAAAQHIAAQPAKDGAAPLPDAGEVQRRLQAKLLTTTVLPENQTAKGYLFYPLADYVKGRVTLEDKESEETEGFVVEF